MRLISGVILMFCTGVLAAKIRPVALATLTDGRLIELDRSNTLIMIIETQSGFDQRLITTLPKRLAVIDLAANGNLNEGLIFVVSRGKDIATSSIMRYTSTGEIMQRWVLPISYPSGIALDYSRGILYISTLLDVSIYQVGLNDKGGRKPVYIMQVPSATRLGALAVDEAGGRLFVADPFSGTIYAVSLATRQSSLLVSELGEPSALALGPGANVLYVADRAHRCVWAVPLNQGPPHPVRFWSSKELKEPLGLVVSSNGRVWIGDSSAKAIFGVTANGQTVIIR
jgi:sugar lactone lactonase YvrE